MTSWRDSASETAQNDLDGLLDAALPFAQEQLAKHGEFFPYGVSLDTDGEDAMVAADPGLGEQPASNDVLDALVTGLRQQRETLRAAALVSDVRLKDTDAIRVQLEHSEGHAFAAYLPYAKKRLRGLQFGDLAAASSDHQIWV